MRRVLKLLLLSILICVHAHGENLSSAWKIILPKQPHVTEAYAAEELQHYLQRMTGHRLDIIRSQDVPERRVFVIGTPQTMAAIRSHQADLGLDKVTSQDRLAVKTLGERVFLAGNEPRSALYAVYTFLTDVCGIHWLWQGDSGEFVPRRQLAMGDWDITWESSFKYRGFHMIYANRCSDPEMETWMARHRLNFMRSGAYQKENLKELVKKGFHLMFSAHSVNAYVVPNKEWYALRNGKRDRHHVCWSNPEVIDFFIRKFTRDIQAHPEVEIYQMFPDDNRYYCECPECSKTAVPERWHTFLKKVVTGIRKSCPQVKFATIAYEGYKEPPKQADVSYLDLVEFCQYDRCLTHSFGDCEMNALALRNLEAWRAKKIPLGIYGYEFDVLNGNRELRHPFLPFYSLLANQMKRYKELGIVSILPEVIPGHSCGLINKPTRLQTFRLGYYVYAAMLNDPDRDVADVLGTFCRVAYQDAAPYLLSYHQLMDSLWSKINAHPSHYGNSPQGLGARFLNDQSIKRVNRLFQQADQAVAAVEDYGERLRVTQEVNLEKDLFKTWKLIHDHDLLTQQTMVIPRNRKPWDFHGALHIADFESYSLKKPSYPTEMWVNYDAQAIYFKVVCHDPQIQNLKARNRKHDTRFWEKGDECFDLFICAPEDQASATYRQFSVNALGTRYECTDCNGDRKDTWNADWEARVTLGKDRHQALIRIPFTAFGKDPRLDGVWCMSAVRECAVRKDCGAAVYPNRHCRWQPAGFVPMVFSPRQDVPSVAFFCRPPGCFTPEMVPQMGTHLQKAGFHTMATDDEKLFQHALKQGRRDVIVICHALSNFKPDFYQKTILPALEQGTTVVLSSYQPLPLHRYFNDPRLAMTWSGWKIDAKNRKTVTLRDEDWLRKPNDFLEVLKKGNAPHSAYQPKNPEAWTIIGTLRMANGQEVPYLMTRKIGRGLLVVTSADLIGWNNPKQILGGYTHTAMLLENLVHRQKQ